MNRKFLAVAAAALALVTSGARAETFDLTVAGSGTYFYYSGYPGDCPPGGTDLCNLSESLIDWSGTLQVTTASAADGTYSGASLESVVFASAVGPFEYHFGDGLQPCSLCEANVTGMVSGASVTLRGGQVTSIDFDYLFAQGGFTANGMTAAEDPASFGHASDSWHVTGLVSPLAEPAATSSVPEVPASLTMLLGLIPLARWLRPRRRA